MSWAELFSIVSRPLLIATTNAVIHYKEISCANIDRVSVRLAIDRGVGRVVQALKDNDLFNDTVIIFSTDNGGDVNSGGSNYPLSGNKGSLYQGGMTLEWGHHELLTQLSQSCYKCILLQEYEESDLYRVLSLVGRAVVLPNLYTSLIGCQLFCIWLALTELSILMEWTSGTSFLMIRLLNELYKLVLHFFKIIHLD